MKYDSREIEAEVKAILSEEVSDKGSTEIDDSAMLLGQVEEALSTPSAGPSLSGWHHFNRVFGSFRPREFTVFCGTTGSGKTTLLANLSSKLLVSPAPHFVASVETGSIDYLIRLISALEGEDLNTGDPIEKEKVSKLIAKWRPLLSKRGLLLSRYTNKINPRRIMCDMLFAHRQHGAKVALLDNLNFMLPPVNARDSNTEMDRVIHDFIIFCKNVDMHVVMVMHPRKKEDNNGSARVETEYDIKGSSTVVQEAHNVLLLNRPTPAQERKGYDQRVFRELKFAKLRRRGRFAGAKIIFECHGSRYYEKELIE